MLDIIEVPDGKDLVIINSQVKKAGNVLSVQLGDLEYAPDFGVDFEYFLNPEFRFQNQSFKAYLVQRLFEHQVNVTEIFEVLEKLYSTFVFSVGEINGSEGGLIV